MKNPEQGTSVPIQSVRTLVISILCLTKAVQGNTKYHRSQIRQVAYGENTGFHVARSIIDCYKECSKLGTCQSVTYDMTSHECNLNNLALAVNVLACTDVTCTSLPLVEYGVKDSACAVSFSYSCVSNADCTESNTECRDSTCKCTSGLHYDSNKCACVTACDTYGNTYTLEANGYILFSNEDQKWGITLSECKAACETAAGFVCRSIEYRVPFVGLADCRLQSITSNGNTVVPFWEDQLFTRHCAS